MNLNGEELSILIAGARLEKKLKRMKFWSAGLHKSNAPKYQQKPAESVINADFP